MFRFRSVAVLSACLAAASMWSGSSLASSVSVPVQASLAKSCSKAALKGASDGRSLEVCNRALIETMLTVDHLAATHVNRGVVLLRRGEPSRALADFEAALKLDPSLGAALVDRGIAMTALGRPDLAIPDIDRGLALGIDRPEQAYYHRAIAREQLKDVRGAYLDFRKASELKPDWTSARLNLARFEVRRR